MALVGVSYARVFGKCDLALILNSGFGINRLILPQWICLIEAESNFNSAAVTGPTEEGQRLFGLFQIGDHYWCHSNYSLENNTNYCRTECEGFLDDDLRDDVACAKDIYNRYESFIAWPGWVENCKDQPLPNTDACFP